MAEELNYEERKQWARGLFIKDDISLPDIALQVGVDESTVRRWSQEDAWNNVKCSLLTSRRSQMEALYVGLRNAEGRIREGKEITKDVDMSLKYTNAIKNLERELSVSEIIEVFESFNLWLLRKNRVLAQKLIVYFNEFVKERVDA